MLKSMTGYGKCEVSTEAAKITVEIKSVNHRFLEVGVKMPRVISVYENTIRSIVKDRVIRGKLDIYVSYENAGASVATIRYNEDIGRQYFDEISRMKCDLIFENMRIKQDNPDMDVSLRIMDDIDCMQFARLPGVLEEEDEKAGEEVLPVIQDAVNGALDQLIESRTTEGDRLKDDLLTKLETMKLLVEDIEERAPFIQEEYRTKLLNKVNELLNGRVADEAIIATEVTAYADKICTDEEIVRLKAHISNMADCLEVGEDMGRKLDFIAQEMNREANTILSKSDDLRSSDTAIELKTLIEKMREQVQNIE